MSFNKYCCLLISSAVLLSLLGLKTELLAVEPLNTEEAAAVANEVVNCFKANISKIVTWKGDIECSDLEVSEGDEGGKETRKTLLQFFGDAKTENIKTRRLLKEIVFDPNISTDTKKKMIRHDFNLLKKDDVLYEFRIPINDEEPDAVYVRQLLVGGRDEGSNELFYPVQNCVCPLIGYDPVINCFSSISPMPDDRTCEIFREGSIVTLELRFKNMQYYHKMCVDLDKGANMIYFEKVMGENDKVIWKADFQKIQNIWVPQKIHQEIVFPNHVGTVFYWDQEWTNQVLNANLEADLQPNTLGACQGDQGYDFRTEKLLSSRIHRIRCAPIECLPLNLFLLFRKSFACY